MLKGWKEVSIITLVRPQPSYQERGVALFSSDLCLYNTLYTL